VSEYHFTQGLLQFILQYHTFIATQDSYSKGSGSQNYHRTPVLRNTRDAAEVCVRVLGGGRGGGRGGADDSRIVCGGHLVFIFSRLQCIHDKPHDDHRSLPMR
jgi:hypothetical protein